MSRPLRVCYNIKMMRKWAFKTLTRLIFVTALLGSGGVLAASILPETCDAKLHDLMRSRAWMEAQREVEVAETLILKPTSVLAYSCFGDQIADAKGTTIFQEDIDGNIGGVFSGMSFSCSAMADIFTSARCTDVDGATLFPSLNDLVGSDIRPNCSGHNSARNSNWTSANDIVFAAPPRAVDQGGLDKVTADFDKLDGTQCASTYSFTTGVVFKYVKDKALQTKTAGVCLAPGCVYNGSTCVQAP